MERQGAGPRKEKGSARASRCVRFIGAALVALSLLSAASAVWAQPPRQGRSSEVLHAEHTLVSRMAQSLGAALNLSEKYGHFQHLEVSGRDTVRRLAKTLAVDPYPPEERKHLQMALEKLEGYLAVPSRTLESLTPHFKNIRTAFQHLSFVDLALERQGGM